MTGAWVVAVLAAAPPLVSGRSPVHYVQAEAWPSALVAEIEAAYAQLPRALRGSELPGGPLEFEYHPHVVTPFGLGTASVRAGYGRPAHPRMVLGTADPLTPEWSNGHRRFHLYARDDEHDSVDRRATWRLRTLSPADRERLWRRRALVHAVMQRIDDERHLSAAAPWRALNGWVLPLERPFTWSERPLNLAVNAYSRARGQDSASLDLVTFAEELFVPAESLLAEANPVDDQVRCQEFSKTRVLRAALGLADATPGCPAFDEWADLPHLSHVEVLLVQASGRRPESLFGHVLLRPVHTEGGAVRGPSFETAIQLAAQTEEQPGLAHLARGIVGGYRLSVMTLSWRDVEREMLEYEQRSIRRFRLNVDATLTRRLLERVWELERRGSFNYQFFTDNCATGLLWVLRGAFGGRVALVAPNPLVVAPSAVVDDLAAVASVDGQAVPLLTQVPDEIESTCQLAQRSEREREMLDERPDVPDVWRGLTAMLANSTVRQARRDAYARLAAVTPQPPHAFEWWALSARVERCAADLAARRLHEIDLLRVDAKPRETAGFDAPALARAREALFEEESELRRRSMMLDRMEHAQALLASLPRRPPTALERDEGDGARADQALFDDVVEWQARLVREQLADGDPHAFLERERQRHAAELERRAADSLGNSGHWRAQAGVGARSSVDAHGSTGWQGALVVESAGLLELLGDQRLRGFQPGVSLRVLDAEAWLVPRLGWPDVPLSRFTLIAIRSLVESPRWLRSTVWSHLGWGLEVMGDRRVGRPFENRSGFRGELLGTLGRDEAYRTHGYVGVSLGGWAAWGDAAAPGLVPTVAPRVSLGGRVPVVPGHGADALRFEVSYQCLARLGPASSWVHEVEASVGVDVQFGAVLVSNRVVVTSSALGGLAAPTVSAAVLFERVGERGPPH